jgi:hypothetical protein
MPTNKFELNFKTEIQIESKKNKKEREMGLNRAWGRQIGTSLLSFTPAVYPSPLLDARGPTVPNPSRHATSGFLRVCSSSVRSRGGHWWTGPGGQPTFPASAVAYALSHARTSHWIVGPSGQLLLLPYNRTCSAPRTRGRNHLRNLPGSVRMPDHWAIRPRRSRPLWPTPFPSVVRPEPSRHGSSSREKKKICHRHHGSWLAGPTDVGKTAMGHHQPGASPLVVVGGMGKHLGAAISSPGLAGGGRTAPLGVCRVGVIMAGELPSLVSPSYPARLAGIVLVLGAPGWLVCCHRRRSPLLCGQRCHSSLEGRWQIDDRQIHGEGQWLDDACIPSLTLHRDTLLPADYLMVIHLNNVTQSVGNEFSRQIMCVAKSRVGNNVYRQTYEYRLPICR